MLQRGRKSLANIATLRVDGVPSRLDPPSYLTTPERKLFAELIAETSAKHFTPADVPLLVSYVQATLLARRAIKKAGKDRHALAVWERATRTQAVLATKLRLTPSSRIDRKSITLRAAPAGPFPWQES